MADQATELLKNRCHDLQNDIEAAEHRLRLSELETAALGVEIAEMNDELVILRKAYDKLEYGTIH